MPTKKKDDAHPEQACHGAPINPYVSLSILQEKALSLS